MVGIRIDANYIFCELMKYRMEGKMITAYQKMVDRMEIAGLGLKHHRLDNKCLENFKKCIKKNHMTWELVPPDCYQRNIAKQAIQTIKNYFVAILSRVDDRFPYLCGATSSDQQNSPLIYSNKAMWYQKYWHMRMCMGSTTT
jgi:hypothetical protein